MVDNSLHVLESLGDYLSPIRPQPRLIVALQQSRACVE